LTRAPLPLPRAWGALLLGGLAATAGDSGAARTHLATAAAGFDEAGAGLYLATARFHLARTDGVEDPDHRMAEAAGWMLDHGVVQPDRMAALLAPGF